MPLREHLERVARRVVCRHVVGARRPELLQLEQIFAEQEGHSRLQLLLAVFEIGNELGHGLFEELLGRGVVL